MVRWNHFARVAARRGALVLCACLVGQQIATQFALAEPTEAPSTVIGDGRTPLQVRLRVPQARAGSLERIRVLTNAGRIVNVRELEPEILEVTVLPPRVAEAMDMAIKVDERHQVQASAKLRVLPEPRPQSTYSSNGPLALRVPESMVLGQDLQGEVSVRDAPGLEVRLHASAGAISAPQPDGHGRLTAVYSPPAERLPNVVIIVAATGDGTVVDWATTRLIGRPVVSASSEPRASVMVRLGGTEYGPIHADERGHADIRVLAFPGTKEAYTVARDSIGNERVVPLRLGIPSARHAFAICPANSEGLFYFVVDASGKMERGLDIRASSTFGQLSLPVAAQQGFYTAALALPPQAPLDQPIRMQVQVAKDADTRVVCETRVAGEAPTNLQVEIPAKGWVATNQHPLRVLIHASFSGVRKPRVVPLSSHVDFGELTAFEARDADLYEAFWKLPANFGRRTSAQLSVETVAMHRARDAQRVALHPGPPSRLLVTAVPRRLKADGRSESQLTAVVADTYGNPVAQTPQVQQAYGTVTPFRTKSSGVFVATYQAPDAVKFEHDEVRLGLDRSLVTGSVRIGLERRSDRYRIWAGLGYGSNFAKVSGPTGNAGIGLAIPAFGHRLVLGADSALLRGSSRQNDTSGAQTVTLTTTALLVGVRAAYEYHLRRFRPYTGVVAGMGFVHLDASANTAERAIGWQECPAASGFLGSALMFGAGSLWLELTYRYLPLNGANVSGNAGGMATSLGYSMAL